MSEEPKAKRARQMKFLGGVWEMRGKFSTGIKQRFRVEELEWMLEKAKADGKGGVELFTEPRRKKGGGGHAPTHTTICWVYSGEWGWDESKPSREVGEGEGRVAPQVGKDDPFAM